jgi:hypothetical protein
MNLAGPHSYGETCDGLTAPDLYPLPAAVKESGSHGAT